MNWKKKVLVAIGVVFVIIQSIQPARNKSGQVLPADITKIVNVPGNVLNIFQKACYDCHSDNTRYPWYMSVQPLGWMMASHIKEGKANLNFSEFGTYSNRKQANKLRSISKSIEEGSMPISSYTLMHADAKLSKENKELIANWVTKTRDSLSANK
ncbi:MAG: heme-binding domain-containing protein [Bacteroidota bacterium]|nr:heme-binding domain-containing protein [Bacteroidota bacterium]